MNEVFARPTSIRGPAQPESLFAPRSIAIVGASDRPGSWANNVYRNLRRFGFTGPIYAVNPKYDFVWGEPCFPSVEALPAPVDHLVVLIPREKVLEALQQGVSKGLRVATVVSSGFAETGSSDGRALQDALLSFSRQHGTRLVGPNCFGWVAVPTATVAMAYERMPEIRSGPLSLISQSGGAVPLIMQAALERGLGWRYAISMGNAADFSWAEAVEMLSRDPGTRVICLLLEGAGDWRRFLDACRDAVQRGVGVVVLKVGRSRLGQQAALTHTGNLAGEYRAFAAALQEVGGILVETIDEMVDVADLGDCSKTIPTPGILSMDLKSGTRLKDDRRPWYGMKRRQS